MERAGDVLGVKDQVLLEYLKDADRFADLVNGTMFGGRQIVDPQYLTEIRRKTAAFAGFFPERIRDRRGIRERKRHRRGSKNDTEECFMQHSCPFIPGKGERHSDAV